MQQTPVKQPLSQQDAPLAQPPLEETLTFAPEKKGKAGKIIKRIILWGLLAAVLAGIGYTVYVLFFKEDPPPEMMTAFAGVNTIETKVRGSGSVTAQEEQNVVGMAKGEVLEVFVAVGDQVEVGQPLFTVNDEEILRSLNDYETSLNQAYKNLNMVEEEMAGQSLRAEFSGKTFDVKAEKGQIVSKGEVLGVLADDSVMKLTAYYSVAFIEDIAVGQTAEVSIPKSMALLPGTVSRVEHISKITDEGAVLFEVEIELNNPGTLTKGMAATAVIHTPAGIVTPAEASTLEYFREENIKAKTAGEIQEVQMRDYYSFSEGDLLLTMVNEDLDARYASELKALEAARKNYDTVAEEYKYYAPTAELAGQVIAVNVSEGDELTGGGNVVVSIADLSRMMMKVEVDEMYISQLVPGMPVSVMASYDGGGMYEGVLDSVSMQATVGTGMSTFPATVQILNAQGLMSGMWLDYEITTNRVENVLTVPTNAVKYVEGGTVCFVRTLAEWHEEATLDEATAAEVPVGFYAVWVTTGASDASQIEITSGLQEGDEVATTAVQENPYMYY
ncbi:MAG: HlyD family efflux transporter periplasmic adaptor subunit [Clostridia bacterium]|nr:HlyD family efflux transporter periplasmic adaptor subunit [Clostridia bacterium]